MSGNKSLPIHFELLSHLFHGDAIAYESLIGTVAEVRKVIALMVSPEANKNYTERFCSICSQGAGSTPGILLSAVKLIAITEINVCLLFALFFVLIGRMFCNKDGK